MLCISIINIDIISTGTLCVRTFDTRVVANNLWSPVPSLVKVQVSPGQGCLARSHIHILIFAVVEMSTFQRLLCM